MSVFCESFINTRSSPTHKLKHAFCPYHCFQSLLFYVAPKTMSMEQLTNLTLDENLPLSAITQIKNYFSCNPEGHICTNHVLCPCHFCFSSHTVPQTFKLNDTVMHSMITIYLDWLHLTFVRFFISAG